MAATAALETVLGDLGGLDRTPPPIFFDLLRRGVASCNVGMLQHVCEAFDVPVMHWFTSLAPDMPARKRKHRRVVLDDDEPEHVAYSGDASEVWRNIGHLAPLDDPEPPSERGVAVHDDEEVVEVIEDGVPNTKQPIKVGNVYRVETVEEHDDEEVNTDTSFFMVMEVDPEGIAHKGRWLYTHAQVPFVISENLHPLIEECLVNEMWAVFVSDRVQRLGNSDDWVNVTDTIQMSSDAEPVKDGIRVLGVMEGDTITSTSLHAFVAKQLMSQLGRGTDDLRRSIAGSGLMSSTKCEPPLAQGRCDACKRLQPIAYHTKINGDHRVHTYRFGRCCFERIRALWHLHHGSTGLHDIVDALAA